MPTQAHQRRSVSPPPPRPPTIRTKLKALVMYRRLFGDCMVPSNFVVPQQSPWPHAMAGLPLGRIVSHMRVAKRPFALEIEANLAGMGFVWSTAATMVRCCSRQGPQADMRVRYVSWNVAIDALVIYHAVHGHCYVSRAFSVPYGSPQWPPEAWGIVLSSVIASAELHAFQLTDDQLNALHRIGVCTHIPPWPCVVALLERYQRQYQQTFVPIDYVVSGRARDSCNDSSSNDSVAQSDWHDDDEYHPGSANDDSQGSEDGYFSSNDTYRYHESEFGWPCDNNGAGREGDASDDDFDAYDDDRYEYADFDNSGDISEESTSFIDSPLVGNDGTAVSWEDIPLGEFVWALALGFRQLAPERQVRLLAMGLELQAAEVWATVFEGMHSFLRIFGHLSIPLTFTVPLNDDAWDKKLWGQRLGHCTSALHRAVGFLPEVVVGEYHRLHNLVPAPSAERQLFRHFLSSLRDFRAFHGHGAVPPTYSVTGQATHFGELAATVREFKSALPHSDRVALDEAEFVWDLALHALWPELMQAVAAWCREPVPRSEMEPFVSSVLPPHPIGYWLALLCVHEDATQAEARAAIMDTGVDLAARWGATVASLAVFKGVYHHMYVPSDFTVPRAAPWPAAGWGLPLGATVRWVRSCVAHVAAARKRELDVRGFEWDDLPFDEYEAALCVYEQYAAADVSPDVVLPAQAPWPPNLWGYPLGHVGVKRAALLIALSTAHDATLSQFWKQPEGHDGAIPQFELTDVLSALQRYSNIFHSTLIPLLFTIEIGASQWPPEAHGMPLGFLLATLRGNVPLLNGRTKALLTQQ
ncbi:hypothetical protein ACHHYP_14955 [Achlya hypogyna]|uniref:Helicase-associated domain-containing protein n=1 Tax=Achlya hypogyna TaxID=1202772 RepID=A0A1V9YBU9_ACHHY|nr:hypothetical protein ACHHYP_14955 [Achlya hypogyna]